MLTHQWTDASGNMTAPAASKMMIRMFNAFRSLHLRYSLPILFMFSALMGAPTTVAAQDVITFPDSLEGWKPSWSGNLYGTQASYRNWSKGGVNSISVTGVSTFTLLYGSGPFQYGSRFSTRYGRSKVDDRGSRKTDDRITFRNRFVYKLEGTRGKLQLFGNLQFETQFDEGFKYASSDLDPDTLISSWLSPARFSENAGLAYTPNSKMVIEIGLGLKQTFVKRGSLATSYGLGEGDTYRNEGGFTIAIAYEDGLMENLTYAGSLETFTNVAESIKSTDVMFTNRFVGRINSYLNMTFQFDVMYDDDFSKELQISQILSAGLSVQL